MDTETIKKKFTFENLDDTDGFQVNINDIR